MKLHICTWPNPILAAKAEPVAEITEEIQELIKNMIETMYANEGVGLAAPQIGRSIRLLCIDPSGPEKREDLRVLINPVIVSTEGETEYEEGCLSCPEFNSVMKRFQSIKVTALNEKGEEITIEDDGFLAIVLQHEMDHLEGTCITDKASRLKKTMYRRKAKKWADA